MDEKVSTGSIHPDVRIGHVHLKVSDIERSLAFYCGVLGFELIERWGDDAAFISAGGYHHHLGLNTWESKGASPSQAVPQVSITLRCFIRPELLSLMLSAGLLWPESHSKARAITA